MNKSEKSLSDLRLRAARFFSGRGLFSAEFMADHFGKSETGILEICRFSVEED